MMFPKFDDSKFDDSIKNISHYDPEDCHQVVVETYMYMSCGIWVELENGCIRPNLIDEIQFYLDRFLAEADPEGPWKRNRICKVTLEEVLRICTYIAATFSADSVGSDPASILSRQHRLSILRAHAMKRN